MGLLKGLKSLVDRERKLVYDAGIYKYNYKLRWYQINYYIIYYFINLFY